MQLKQHKPMKHVKKTSVAHRKKAQKALKRTLHTKRSTPVTRSAAPHRRTTATTPSFTFTAPTLVKHKTTASILLPAISFASPFTHVTTRAFSTSAPSFIPQALAKASFLPPTLIVKRGFFGGANPMSALSSMMGGGQKQQGGSMNMMQMMEMFGLMQKMTKTLSDGKPMTDEQHAELMVFLDKIKAQSGGEMPPQYAKLFEKLKNKEHVGMEEIMEISGLSMAEFDQIRTMTLDMKSGKMNQMEYIMKIAGLLQSAQTRRDSTTKIE